MVRLKGDGTSAPLVGLETTVPAAAGNDIAMRIKQARERFLTVFIDNTFREKWRRFRRPDPRACRGGDRRNRRSIDGLSVLIENRRNLAQMQRHIQVPMQQRAWYLEFPCAQGE